MNTNYLDTSGELEANFSEVATWWFNHPRVWFNATPSDDENIAKLFGQHLKEVIYCVDLAQCTPLEIVGRIITLDQISRHYFRVHEDEYSYPMGPDEFMEPYNSLAREFALYAIANDIDLSPEIHPNIKSFVLMPLRHTFTYEDLKTVILRVKMWKTSDASREWATHNLAINKFYRASILAMQSPEHRHCLRGAMARRRERSSPDVPDCEIDAILDPNSCSISQFSPLPGSLDVNTLPNTLSVCQKIYGNCHRTLSHYVVSVSGGVDSMVLLTSLVRAFAPFGACQVIAVHINYNNREECSTEVAFLERVCAKLNTVLVVRDIFEINRTHRSVTGDATTADRDLYEEITRKIRFGAYKEALALHDAPACVALGHNRDDTRENMITNLGNGVKFEHLAGMEIDSTEEGVPIFRPMLGIAKADIVRFAHEHNIPYLGTLR